MTEPNTRVSLPFREQKSGSRNARDRGPLRPRGRLGGRTEAPTLGQVARRKCLKQLHLPCLRGALEERCGAAARVVSLSGAAGPLAAGPSRVSSRGEHKWARWARRPLQERIRSTARAPQAARHPQSWRRTFLQRERRARSAVEPAPLDLPSALTNQGAVLGGELVARPALRVRLQRLKQSRQHCVECRKISLRLFVR